MNPSPAEEGGSPEATRQRFTVAIRPQVIPPFSTRPTVERTASSASSGVGLDTPFSVCIAVHNEERSLERIVREVQSSSLWQSGAKKELLLCLNGCTDRSLEIANRLAKADPSILVLESEQKGKNFAWMRLVQASAPDSKALYFVDADVRLPKDTLTQLAAHFEKELRKSIIGARNLPEPEPEKNRGWYRRAMHRMWFDKDGTEVLSRPSRRLSGQCYAITRETAKKIQMPSDQAIMEDAFLRHALKNSWTIAAEAKIYYRTPTFGGAVKQQARYEISRQRMAREYPHFEDQIGHRDALQDVGRIEHLRSLPFSTLVGTVMRHAAARIYATYLTLNNKDSWGKVKSSQM
ncbi:MAG: glycosyltransferase family 2 protein [Bdellovibrionales bacterium]|nr:glycosyltransferase family 2 protein [Bdellovibrionales bacterium]